MCAHPLLLWSWRESRSALPLSQSEATERTLTRVRPHEGVTKWSWRESNPRPNKETIRFLHAYSRLCFRDTAGPGPPTAPLSSKTSSRRRGPTGLFPICLRRLILGFGTTPLGRRLVRLPCKRIKPVIYYTSIRQREHTHCCQLILCSLCFRR